MARCAGSRRSRAASLPGRRGSPKLAAAKLTRDLVFHALLKHGSVSKLFDEVLMSRRAYAAAILMTCTASGASAADLGKLRSSAPDDQFQSDRSMYDIERCMIEVDALAIPTVYRQPDRPDAELIAWETAILIEMTTNGNGTKLVAHFQSGGARKARKRLLACAGYSPPEGHKGAR